MTTLPAWRKLEPNEISEPEGIGYEFTKARYRARYETCVFTGETEHLNRKWTVWFEYEGKSYIVANGACHGSEKAEAMILSALNLLA